MRSYQFSKMYRAVSAGLILPAVLMLGACAQPGGSGPSQGAASQSRAPAPKADYPTASSHFLALQKAGLAGDYAGFAKHLRSEDAAAIAQQLTVSFSGQPFDVYTQRSNTKGSQHVRAIELRGTRGRLYLYLQLQKVTGGWAVADYTLERNRGAVLAKL